MMIKIFLGNSVEILEEAKNSREAFSRLGVHFDCSHGICGMCKIKVNSGMNDINSLTEEEMDFQLEVGERLACQCKEIKGDVKVEHGSW